MPKLRFTSVRGPHIAQVRSGKGPVEVRVGRRLSSVPLLDRVDELSLGLRTIAVTTKNSVAASGVPVTVAACCQVKVRAWALGASGELRQDPCAARLAAQHFLARPDRDVDRCIRDTVEGHQRAIVATLTVEQLYRDRDAFSRRVSELCSRDMREMGLCIVSYTVVEISDERGYIHALGVTQTELVKRRAVQGKAFHENRARARKAKEHVDAHVEVNAQLCREIASDASREIRRADAQRQIDAARAVQQKAHLIADAEEDTKLFVKRQNAKSARVQAELDVVRQLIEVERLVKQRSVHTAADAMLYKATVDADSLRQTAHADADKITLLANAQAHADAALIKECGSAKARVDALHLYRNGVTEAAVLREKGLADIDVRIADAAAVKAVRMAEADVMHEALVAWNEFGSRGIVIDKIVDELPNIAGAIAAPLAKTGKMVFVGCGSTAGDASRIVADPNGIDDRFAGGYGPNGYA